MKHKLVVSLLAVWMVACKSENPALTGTPKPAPPVSYAAAKPDPYSETHEFKFQNSSFTAEQAAYDRNAISISFEVTDANGKSVNGLKDSAFQVLENGQKIAPFKLSANTQKFEKLAEIALVVDITKSMGPFIENAKIVLQDFIHSSRERGYRVRFCLATFGDRVVDHCERFYDNGDKDQVAELVSNLTKLYAHKGKEDPGGVDIEENPMRALVETTKAQWTPDAQRFVVLVTDADFYSPDKENDARRAKHLAYHQSIPEEVAPTSAEVTQAIQSSGVKVFAVVPSRDSKGQAITGYTAPLAGQPDVVAASGGTLYDFNQTVNGKKDAIKGIFENILRSITTTYRIDYVEEEVGGKPDLKLAERKIEIRTSAGTVTARPATSTMPEGRPQYKQAWQIDSRAIDESRTTVTMNGKALARNEYAVSGGEVRFTKIPPPGAKLAFTFQYVANAENFRVQPVAVKGRPAADTVRVWLNDRLARQNVDYTLDASADGNTNVNFTSAIMNAQDPFGIRAAQGLRVKVTSNYSL